MPRQSGSRGPRPAAWDSPEECEQDLLEFAERKSAAGLSLQEKEFAIERGVTSKTVNRWVQRTRWYTWESFQGWWNSELLRRASVNGNNPSLN